MHDITVLDSVIGAAAMASVSSSLEYLEHSSNMYDCTFFGETESPDCPD
jgi:hypothetical protein